MVVGKIKFTDKTSSHFVPNSLRQIQFQVSPQRKCLAERFIPIGRIGEIGLEKTLELDHWFFIESDRIQGRDIQSRFAQAILDRQTRKPRVVFAARKPFFLSGGNNLTIPNQSGGGIMIKRGNSEDRCHGIGDRKLGAERMKVISDWRFISALPAGEGPVRRK